MANIYCNFTVCYMLGLQPFAYLYILRHNLVNNDPTKSPVVVERTHIKFHTPGL